MSFLDIKSLGSKELQKVVLLEGDVLPSQDWLERMDLDTRDLKELCDQGVLRKAQSTFPGDRLRLDFVGIIARSRGTYFSLPKVYDPNRKSFTKADLSKILRCIQRYQGRISKKSSSTVSPLDGHLFTEGGEVLSLFLKLLSWTRDHGLHSESIAVISDDLAHVDWGKTIDRGLGLHFRTGIAFGDFYGERNSSRISNLAIVQASALLDLFDQLGIVSSLWISSYDSLIEDCRLRLQEVGSSNLRQSSIRDFLTDADLHSTRDHDRELVAILKQWYAGSYTRNNGTILYGVNAFHTIWEDMCSAFLGDNSTLNHDEVASQASYRLHGKNYSLSTQRPDYVSESSGIIQIADAKWYRIWKDELPQLSDVMKQFMYELTVRPPFSVGDNFFLVPNIDDDCGSFEKLGTVCMEAEGQEDKRFPVISVIGAQWDAVVDCYISGGTANAASALLTSHSWRKVSNNMPEISN